MIMASFLRMLRVAALVSPLGLNTGTHAQDARSPEAVIDAFHQALRTYNTAGALSLLGRELMVFEFGVVDPTLEAYAFQHLPFDMDTASQTVWTLTSREVGGSDEEPWVVSTYRVTGVRPDQVTPIDQTTTESVILRRTGDQYRIIHFHWSTDDPLFQAEAQAARTGQIPGGAPVNR
jgi:hypothetical protein